MDITGRIGYIEGYNHDLVITKDKYLEIYPKCGYNCGNIQKTAKFPVMLCIRRIFDKRFRLKENSQKFHFSAKFFE